MGDASQRTREIALALSVGVVLADSSIVTLALPDILQDFDSTVVGVSWVLTAFNLALALAILPAARVGRVEPRAGWAVGLAIFVGASAGCAAADSEAVLVTARIVQALGGALTIACAIELLARMLGSHERAAPLWGSRSSSSRSRSSSSCRPRSVCGSGIPSPVPRAPWTCAPRSASR